MRQDKSSRFFSWVKPQLIVKGEHHFAGAPFAFSVHHQLHQTRLNVDFCQNNKGGRKIRLNIEQQRWLKMTFANKTLSYGLQLEERAIIENKTRLIAAANGESLRPVIIPQRNNPAEIYRVLFHFPANHPAAVVEVNDTSFCLRRVWIDQDGNLFSQSLVPWHRLKQENVVDRIAIGNYLRQHVFDELVEQTDFLTMITAGLLAWQHGPTRMRPYYAAPEHLLVYPTVENMLTVHSMVGI
ncbi:MAG: hypothetical protein ACKKL5_00530 [Candidatus Komeilibacteria bacterium]